MMKIITLYDILNAYFEHIESISEPTRLTMHKIKKFCEELEFEEWKCVEYPNELRAILYIKNLESYFCDIIQGLLQYNTTFGVIIKVTNKPLE